MTILTTLSVFATSIIAQAAAPEAAPAGQPSGGGGLFGGGSTMIFFYVLLFAGMYFLLFAPQRKKQKEHQKLLSQLDTGDQVLLASGIFGEITNRKEDRFVVRIADGVKIEVAKNFVQTVIKKKNADDQK
jgi:preprotein translocase subunit YajC